MNRIKEARLAAGLSQKFVALSLGLKAPSVCNWENGKTTPTPENYAALANLFGVTIDYLMGADETQGTPTPQSSLVLQLNEFSEMFQQMDASQREAIIALMRSIKGER